MKKKTKHNIDKDKKRNRFLKLRYKENSSLFDTPDITLTELAAELNISKGLISKLESPALEDYHDGVPGDIPPCRASTLKLYHDRFNCSYEYLMGETSQEKPQYAETGKSLPFSMMDSQDIDNLALIFSEPMYGELYALFFKALLSKPGELKGMIESLLKSLLSIYNIQCDKDIMKSEKELTIRPVRYTYTNIFAEQMEKYFIPAMEKVFSKYEEILSLEHNRDHLHDFDFPDDTVTVKEPKITVSNITEIKITPIDPDMVTDEPVKLTFVEIEKEDN